MGIHISVEQIIFVSYGYTCIKLDKFTSYIESCHFSNAFYMEIDPSMNKFIRDLHINLDIEGSKC